MNASVVNLLLTSNRRNDPRPGRRTPRRRTVENDDYAGFTRRIITAHGRRIAAGDIEGLAALAEISISVDAALSHAVHGLREQGFSWADIGTRLGITRQAAQQRFGTRSGDDR